MAKKAKANKDPKFQNGRALGVKTKSEVRASKNGKALLTKASNKAKSRSGTDLATSDVRVVEYVRKHGHATVKELASALFGGDYLKAKNAVRRPRWNMLITHGSKRGEYVPGEAL